MARGGKQLGRLQAMVKRTLLVSRNEEWRALSRTRREGEQGGVYAQTLLSWWLEKGLKKQPAARLTAWELSVSDCLPCPQPLWQIN